MNLLQWARWEVLLLGLVPIYLTRTIYRLYLHPLAKFPGPRLTATTSLYEVYHDIIRGRRFVWEIEKMHEKYGPIVRITPNELHIKDSSFYHEIYTSAPRKRNKDPNFVGLFGSPTSMIASVDHDHHRFRRGILGHLFSKRSINNISPLIHAKVQRLMERLEQFRNDDRVVHLSAAFVALAADIITSYSYGESCNFLDDETFRSDVRDAIIETEELDHITRLYPFVLTVLHYIPLCLFAAIKPATAIMARVQKRVAEKSASVIRATESGKSKGTLFDALTDPHIPASERTPSRIHDEGMILLSGGTEPAANALTVAAFHIIRNKDILSNMRTEIEDSGIEDLNTASLAELEQLPYLTAVINEAVRLSHGLTIRTPRIAPNETLKYEDYIIPAKAHPLPRISMSSYFVHMDPAIFPNPTSFNPNRWEETRKRGDNISQFITSFGKGSRQCIGINLAYADLYFTLASFATSFDYELHDTTEASVRVALDRGVPFPETGHFMVKARVVGRFRSPTGERTL
ncbi:cytochrome P450 [Aspergillus karnatakaensis]|uniref:cytochrome P450 n=1 Tax=Aspergillus karnatakaensis TaxID=1810916 RepID=UPI003CCCA984